MEIVKNEGNKELVYELVYNYDEILKLIREIIDNCSFKKGGRYVVEARTTEEAIYKINNTMYINEYNVYSNVVNVHAEPVHDPFDYWRHGDPSPYSFIANKLVVPSLVSFLIRVINNEQVDYDWFINDKELNTKENLELEIKQLDSEINEISNFDTDKKIEKLKELGIKINVLSNFPKFDYELLSEYYRRAKEIVKLELVQETIKYRKRSK